MNDALTSNESYHWGVYAFSLSNGSPFKLSLKPALTGVLTIPIKASPTTELLPTRTTSELPSTKSPSPELPTSGPNLYGVIIIIGVALFLAVFALITVFVVLFVKKSQSERCDRYHVHEGNRRRLLPPSEPPAVYQPSGYLDPIPEDGFVNVPQEMHPINEQEAVIENNNVTVSSFVVQHSTCNKPRKRPASISLPPFSINVNEISLSPHAASQPNTPIVPTPEAFSFAPPPGPTRNSSNPQLPSPPS